MAKRSILVGEVRWLIHEQMAALKESELTPEAVETYAERSRRIRELLELIANDGLEED